jgi:hypothetical protein
MDTQEAPKENQNITLDRKSKVLFVIIGLLIVGSVAVTFWRYMMKRDYIIQAQTDCDPTTENCFVWKCDPASSVEGEACTGDEESDTWYYKIIRRNAKNIPLCDPNDENCTALVCDPGEKDCSEELCTDDNVPEGESCNDPEQYLIDNPPEEECAEDDEECLAEQEAIECEEGDEECLAEEAAAEEKCASADQECLDAQESEDTEEVCAPDDPTCDQTQDATTSPDKSDATTP